MRRRKEQPELQQQHNKPSNNVANQYQQHSSESSNISHSSREERGGQHHKGGHRDAAGVGSTVAALAAVLAAAPVHGEKRQQQQQMDRRRKQQQHLLTVPAGPSDAVPLSPWSSPRPACSSFAGGSPLLPHRPASTGSSVPPAMSYTSPSSPPLSHQQPLLHTIRRGFRFWRRRSVSEISLVLELLRGATREGSEERAPLEQRHRFFTASPAVPVPAGDAQPQNEVQEEQQQKADQRQAAHQRAGTIRRGGASTGNLSRKSTQKSQRKVPQRRGVLWQRLSPAAIQRQLGQVQEEKAMLQAPTAPIDASKFVAYVQERRKKRILFKGEFLMIQRSVDPQRCTTEVAIRMGDRNQYPDTLPFDHNRVVLELRPGIDDSHYINASYVNSWVREKAYVVTQSVRSKQASNELWRCVWELGSNTMVMLTKIFDFMRVMCLQYWPQTHFQFGEIHVETLETRTYAHYVVRTFRLRKTGGPGGLAAQTGEGAEGEEVTEVAKAEERIVKHFHFTEWELNSFPYISAFIELRRRVRQWTERNPVDAPIVVHCSSGGGRSGAFLAVDANLELLQRSGQLDVYEYGRTLANSRQHLIDSVEQFMFIYDVLCEAVLCNVQPIAMHQLKDRSSMYKARRDRELMELQDSHENKLLMMLTAPLRIGDCAGGHRLENRGKNRDVMVVPPDHARPYLQTLHGESKDYTYINAVEVDGFTRKSEFIVTEWPKQQTLDSFWTLIFDHNVHTVICLTNQPADGKMYPQFVHNKGKRNYGPFTVEVVNYQQYPGLQSHMVKISKRPTEQPRIPLVQQNRDPEKGVNKKLTFMISEIMATGASQQQLEAEVRLCCIIQVKMWPIENKVPLSTTALIEVLKMTRSWRKRAPDRPEQRPTIVMSHNGVSRCGIFIAANVCIDQMEMDHEVDVFHAVKLIRINRPQLIDMKDEYKYLYDLMLHWYMTSEELRAHEPVDAVSIVSENEEGGGSDGDSEHQEMSLLTRSRSGSARRRSHHGGQLSRSKSSRQGSSRRRVGEATAQRTPTFSSGTTLAVSPPGTAQVTRNSSSVSGRKKEPVYLN